MAGFNSSFSFGGIQISIRRGPLKPSAEEKDEESVPSKTVTSETVSRVRPVLSPEEVLQQEGHSSGALEMQYARHRRTLFSQAVRGGLEEAVLF